MPSLESDIEGRIKRLSLKPSVATALMPLFEAVSNSVHAIQDRFNEKASTLGEIKIEVLRFNAEDGDNSVAGFVITDNGVGFTNENFNSFLRPDSQLKMKRGGKGVGRLGWLKIFGKIQIDSSYLSDGTIKHRSFDFVLAAQDQIRDRDTSVVSQVTPGTRVTLTEYDSKYANRCPTKELTLIDHLVGHFLALLVTDSAPMIRYIDTEYDIDLRKHFKELVIERSDVEVIVDLTSIDSAENNITLTLRHVKAKKEIRGLGSGYHHLFLTAHDRAVEEYSLDEQLGLKVLDGENVYLGCAFGEYLNDHVNQERTRFTFEAEERKAIRRALAKAARAFLDNYVQVALQLKARSANDIIADNPQFLYLKSGINEFVSNKLSPNAFNREDILVEMSRDRFRKISTYKNIEKEILQAPILDKVVADKIEDMQQFIQDQQRGALAEYVLRRKVVLDLLDKYSGYETVDTAKHFKEDIVHKLICPMKIDSSQVDFQNHNLWILDDRLAFFSFFASDKEIGSYTDESSGDRPDIAFFYDSCFAWRGTEDNPNTIVLIEFKRPGREDYSKEGPLTQVIRYVEKFKSTDTLKDAKGRVLSSNAKNANFQCYIIADRTKGLDGSLMGQGELTPDGEGLYGYTSRPKFYYEIIPYAKLLRDAKNRNAVFFLKLGLTDHGK